MLLESRMDSEVTRLSRECISSLTHFISKGNVPIDEAHSVEFPIRYNGKEVGTLVFSVAFVSYANPKRYSRRAGTYEPVWDGTHHIEIMIARPHSILDDGAWKQHMHIIVEDIKVILQHELEHMRSAIQGRHPEFADDRDEESLKGWLAYLLQPHEVEAHVVEFMRRAKMRKIPLSVVIDAAAENRVRDFRTWDDEAASAAKERILDAWRSYVKKRFPRAP